MASVINALQVGTGAVVRTNQIFTATNFYLHIRFHAHSKEARANPQDYEAAVRWSSAAAWEPVAAIVAERSPDLRFAPFHLFAITRPHVYGTPGSRVVLIRIRNRRTGHIEESQIWTPFVRATPQLALR